MSSRSLLSRRTSSGISVGKWNYQPTYSPQQVTLVWTYNNQSPKDFALYFWRVDHNVQPHPYFLYQDHIPTFSTSGAPSASHIVIKLDTVKFLVPGGHYKPVLAKSGVNNPNSRSAPSVIYDEGSLSFVYQPNQAKSKAARK